MEAIECFRKNLKELMKEQEISFEELGKRVKLNPRTMRRWLTESIPKVESLIKIADYFGCSCDYLLGLSDTFEFIPSKNPSNFYARYSLLLNPLRFKDSKIADLCEIGRGTVSKWKQGRMPDVYILVKLCKIFDCGFEYLVGRSDG